MESVNIWNTLAQSGIAILILAVGAFVFWKQIQALISGQEARIKTLEANVIELQKDKDALQKEFRDTLTQAQDKHAELENKWMQALADNTSILKDLKTLIEQKF
jgi:F0F1-type ATP synthase membrane subunit b/b'